MSAVLERIRANLVGLRMPRALEALDHTVQRPEQGEIGALEATCALRGRGARATARTAASPSRSPRRG